MHASIGRRVHLLNFEAWVKTGNDTSRIGAGGDNDGVTADGDTVADSIVCDSRSWKQRLRKQPSGPVERAMKVKHSHPSTPCHSHARLHTCRNT